MFNFFSSFNQSSEQELLVNCISDEIEKEISSMTFANIDKCYHFVGCLNEVTQNFRPAIVAMGKSVNSIVTFIKGIIRVFDNQLKTEISPAQKNEVSHQLHCSVQAVIFCIKTYFSEPRDISNEVKANIDEIVEKCVDFLDCVDLPMDTKNNSSMLIVMNSKLTGDNRYVEWIKDEKSSSVKRLSLIFGVINTLNASCIDYHLLASVAIILKNVYMESSVDPASLLAVARSFMQMTRKLASMESVPSSRQLIHITETALSIAFLNLDHHVDSIRHLSRDTLRYLSEIGTKLNDNEELLKSIFSEIKRLSSSNACSIVVASISPVLKTSKVIEKLPFFHKRLLKSVNDNKVTNHNLINCYESLALKGLEEASGFEAWFLEFVQPPIDEMMKHPHQSEERTTFENLIVRFIKKEKRILDEVLKNRGKFDFGFILLCLSTAKKTGRYDQVLSTETEWKGLISFKEIRTAMVNADDNIRTSALMLIVESRKTTDGFNQQELDCIIYFLTYNVNVQSPAMRQSILGLVKNFFVRIQSVLQAIIRKKETKLVDFYFDFLVELQELCLDNLFEGANFTRRNLSLRLLFYIVEAVHEHFKEKSADLWKTKQKFDVMMNVLNDSFEANKEMAIEIMKSIPTEVMRKFTAVTKSQLQAMVTSIKPPDSLTSSYLMEFVVKFTFNFEEFPGEQPKVSPESFLMLTWCEKLLLDGLDLAEKSLIVASSTNPLYGLVLNIRHLMSRLDLKTLGNCQLWRDYFGRLIILCKRLTEVVAPVVNNNSPEGILPNEEIEGIDAATREEWMRIAEQTTPQIILLCSWRTIKEVSLLLGDVCLRVPLINDGVGLLSVEQILSIGDHFLELLSKTKHRGAFEQCFFGFSQLCLRLWTCNEPELHQLPSAMLHQMIDSISGKDKEKNELLTMKNLCATRRSAGLPFMIQALITSELKVSTNKNFHFVMKSLMNFCQHGELLETRTHSLNILRALFRCSDLNVDIGEYIDEGIKCAILGYGAESWIETNSSTLLFSSLMVRVFGVQRTKDSEEFNIRNKMTGRIFFLRYPQLYDFFMEQLEEAAECVKNVKMNPKLHSLLLLLIRLYPSALEGSESNLKLTNFIPVVAMCSGCVEMQTRVLCAKFIAGVSPPDSMPSRILETIATIEESQNLPANVAHGILLQILYQVRTLPSVQQDEWKSEEVLLEILDKIMTISDRFKSQLICYGTLLDVVLEIYEKLWRNVSEDSEKHLGYIEQCMKFDQTAFFGLPMIAKKVYLLKQMSFGIREKSQGIGTLSLPNVLLLSAQTSATSDFEKLNKYFTNLVLNSILMYLDFDYAVKMQDDYEISDKEFFVCRQMSDAKRAFLKMQTRQLGKLTFGNMLASTDYSLVVKSLDILSMIAYYEGESNLEELKGFIEKAKTKPEQMKKSLLKYASSVAKHENFVHQLDFEFLVEISTDSSYFVK